MTKIYLIRHGQTQGNLERRYIGSTDQPLCPQGRAALAGRALPPVDRVYVSPLLRCRETAEILYPGQPQKVIPDLRECSFGAFELHTYEELQGDAAYQAWLDSGGTAAPPGGEGKASQQARTVRAFQGIAARHPQGTVALVVHGGTIMSLLEALEGSGQFYQWQAPNGGGYLCRWDGHGLTVEAAL